MKEPNLIKQLNIQSNFLLQKLCLGNTIPKIAGGAKTETHAATKNFPQRGGLVYY